MPDALGSGSAQPHRAEVARTSFLTKIATLQPLATVIQNQCHQSLENN